MNLLPFLEKMKPNYKIHNYCTTCKIVYPKTTIRCPDCNFLLRTKPASGIRNKKYLELKARI